MSKKILREEDFSSCFKRTKDFHIFGGYMIMIAGVLIIISSLMTSPVYSTFLLMGWLILSMLITVFYSYKVYLDELSRTDHKK